MRVRLLCLLLMITFFTAACAANAESGGDIIREHYAALGDTDYHVTVRTDFGDRVLDFTVDYSHRQNGSGHIKILTPESVAGVEAEFSPDGAGLQYDGVIIDLGALPGTGLSPMESLPFIIGQWSGGYVTHTGSEKRAGRELITVTHRVTQDGKTLTVTTWFDKDTLAPVTAELLADEFLTVSLFFE